MGRKHKKKRHGHRGYGKYDIPPFTLAEIVEEKEEQKEEVLFMLPVIEPKKRTRQTREELGKPPTVFQLFQRFKHRIEPVSGKLTSKEVEVLKWVSAGREDHVLVLLTLLDKVLKEVKD